MLDGENSIRISDQNFEESSYLCLSPSMVLSSQQKAEMVKPPVITKRLSDNMLLSSIINSLAGLAALALAPKWWPSSLLLCQPGARLSEGTLPDSLVFISPRRDAEVSEILNQLNMHSVTR